MDLEFAKAIGGYLQNQAQALIDKPFPAGIEVYDKNAADIAIQRAKHAERMRKGPDASA